MYIGHWFSREKPSCAPSRPTRGQARKQIKYLPEFDWLALSALERDRTIGGIQAKWLGILRARAFAGSSIASWTSFELANLVAREIVGPGRQRSISTWDGEILRTRFLPLHHAESRRSVRNASGPDCHAGRQFYIPIHSRDAAINVTEVALRQFQHSNVRILPDRQCPQVWPMDLLCRIDCRHANDILQRHSHGQEFRHHVVHAKNQVVVHVQIGRDGIRDEFLFRSRNCIPKPETASPMSHIEDHASCPGFCDGGIELAVGKDDRKLLRENVGVYVARPHFLEYQVLISTLWPRPEIKHDRTICENAALNRTVNRSPGSVFSIPRSPGPVMGGFYSHDEVGIFLDGVDTKFHIHFVQALFKPTVHAICHDIQEGQHSYSGAVNDFFLFLKKR